MANQISYSSKQLSLDTAVWKSSEGFNSQLITFFINDGTSGRGEVLNKAVVWVRG